MDFAENSIHWSIHLINRTSTCRRSFVQVDVTTGQELVDRSFQKLIQPKTTTKSAMPILLNDLMVCSNNNVLKVDAYLISSV